MERGLGLGVFCDRAPAVADSGRLFELEPRGTILHLIAHLAEKLQVLSFEQHLRRMQMAFVLFAIDGQAAWPEASLDLIFEAWPRTIAKDRVGAGAERERFSDYVDRLAESVGGTEGAEVASAVFHDFTGDRDSRPSVMGDLRAQIGFVVLQPDVVLGLVLLNQVVLEDQRLLLAGSDDGVEVADAAHQEAHLEAAVAALAEVGAHAGAEVLPLADVEDFAATTPNPVTTGPAPRSPQLTAHNL